MRQWHKAVARSMHWNESEEIRESNDHNDDSDPHLTRSIPQYRKRPSADAPGLSSVSTALTFCVILSFGIALGVGLIKARRY
jgi:hypothetical protein